MSLININNAMSTYGQVRSVQLSNLGSTLAYLDQTTTIEHRSYLALTHANGLCTNKATGYVSMMLGNFFVGEWSLYSLQARLNDEEWAQTGLVAEVEFGVHTTGHGDVSDSSHEIILLVKTTWQK